MQGNDFGGGHSPREFNPTTREFADEAAPATGFLGTAQQRLNALALRDGRINRGFLGAAFGFLCMGVGLAFFLSRPTSRRSRPKSGLLGLALGRALGRRSRTPRGIAFWS